MTHHNKIWSYNCDSIEKINYPESTSPILKINNLSIINSVIIDKDPVKIPGKTYIQFTDKFMWHFIQDGIAQYEVINKYIGDVNILFFDIRDINKESITNESASTYFKYIKKSELFLKDIAIEYNAKDILNFWLNNYFFEEAYLIYDNQRIIKKDFFKEKNIDIFWNSNPELPAHNFNPDETPVKWQILGLNLFKEKFSKHLIKNEYHDKKIYISRKDAHRRYYQESNNGNDYSYYVQHRYFSDEEKLESFFTSKGYESITLEGMDYIDQINIFYNAKIIVGAVGTGFLNSLFCKEDARVIQLFLINSYGFNYNYINNDFEIIDLRNLDQDMDKILLELCDEKYDL